MAVLRRPDTTVAYEVTGEGPALLLTPGFGATQRMWAPNLPALSADHRVVTWDVRGHGASGSPEDPAGYRPSAALGDMVALLDHLGIERVTPAGHSLGGFLSLELALAHPERIDRLVLVDTGPGYRRDDSRAGWNRLAERFATNVEARGVAGLGASDELGAADHSDPQGLILAARHLLTQHDGHVIEGLATIVAPTLVIVGGDDTNFLAGSAYMAAKIPGARLVTIAGAGHTPNLTHRAEFEREVLAFLREPV
jgi:pimeloyl-ACP methyl ester carboxylesterase